jgi:SPW repeat
MKAWRRESVLDVYNLLLAALLFASPWLFKLTNGTARMDFWIGGAAIAAISIGAIVAFASWEEWANLALGAWLVASPWILGFAHARATHFSVAIGAAVAYLALIELWLQYDATHFARPTPDNVSGGLPQR